MIIDEYEIPSSFHTWDSTVADPDQFVNVAELQRFRRNHNKLLAERIRRTVLCQQYCDSNGVGALYYRFHQLIGSGYQPMPMVSAIVGISDWTRECSFRFEAKRENIANHGDTQVDVYPQLVPLGRVKEIDTSVTVAVTSTSRADHSIDIDVPMSTIAPYRVGGMHLYNFEVYVNCPLDRGGTNNPKGGATDLEVLSIYGSSKIEVDDTAGVLGSADQVGREIVFPSDTEIEPRTIIECVHSSSTPNPDYYTIKVDRPFNKLPTVLLDRAQVRDAMGISFSTLMLYEKPTTEFYGAQDLIT